MLDIYTKQPIVTPSDEHILLNAFGGRWVSRDLIDKTTNDGFGHGIDAGIANAFMFVRVLADVKSGDGQPAPLLRGARSADGSAYNLRGGAIPEMAKPEVTVTESADGHTTLNYTVRSTKELRHLTSRIAKTAGLTWEQIEATAVSHESIAPPVSVPESFGPNTWRCIAKMACNLMAAADRDLFLDEAFDDVRSYVLNGGNPWDFVAINTQPVDVTSGPGAVGPLDHLLVVRSDVVTGLVLGFIALYGHFQVCVRLGALKTPKTLAASYRVDQVGCVDRTNGLADLDLTIPPFVPLRDCDQQHWYDAMEIAINRMTPVLEETMDRAAIAQMVSDSMRDAFGGERKMTPEGLKDFRHRLMARVRRFVEHSEHLGEDDIKRVEASLTEILGA